MEAPEKLKSELPYGQPIPLLGLYPEKRKKVKLLGHVQLFVTQWTIAYQATLSMKLSRHRYWSGLPFPAPGGFPHAGINPVTSCISYIGKQIFYHCTTWEALNNYQKTLILHSVH